MTKEKALDILERHNRWRRGSDYVEETDPRLLGIAIDKAIEVLRLSIFSDSISDSENLKNNEVAQLGINSVSASLLELERDNVVWRDDFGREMKEGDFVSLGSDVNNYFVQGNYYVYCFSDSLGQYCLSDGVSFISIREIKEHGISLTVC